MNHIQIVRFGRLLERQLQRPPFLSKLKLGGSSSFIDGGLGCNNPSQVVLDEAEALFGARQIGCLVSIGTGQAEVVVDIKKPGLFQQIIPTDVIDALEENHY